MDGLAPAAGGRARPQAVGLAEIAYNITQYWVLAGVEGLRISSSRLNTTCRRMLDLNAALDQFDPSLMARQP